jgi:hypothetical protein
MAERSRAGGDVFIVDNSDTNWKVARYLRDWCDIADRTATPHVRGRSNMLRLIRRMDTFTKRFLRALATL